MPTLYTFLPATAHAETDSNGIELPASIPPIDTIPDTYGYITLTIPQCDDCNGIDGIGWERSNTTFPEHDWLFWIDPRNFASIIGEFFSWIFAGIKNLFLDLFCFILMVGQHIANWIASATNAIIALLNATLRWIVYLNLALNSAWFGAWYWFENSRIFWNFLLHSMNLIWHYILMLVEMLALAMSLAAEIIFLLAQAAIGVVGLISYVLGLVVAFITDMVDAMTNSAPPEQLAHTPGHPLYSMIRGSLDALMDSDIAWMLHLSFALGNIAFIFSWIKGMKHVA